MNQLILGDCLEVMKKMDSESVDLIYLDPPFFSNRNYEVIWGDKGEVRSFEDRWSGGIEHYIAWLKERVAEIHRLLKPTGSIYLHCDWHANSHIRVHILDRIFNYNNFMGEIIWQRTNAHNDAKKKLAVLTDTIWYYSKSDKFKYNPTYGELKDDYIKKNYNKKDEKGFYMSDNLTGAGTTKGDSSLIWRGYDPTIRNRHWALPTKILEELMDKENLKTMNTIDKLELLYQNKYIEFSSNGTPRFKRYLDNNKGQIIGNLWNDIQSLPSQSNERIGYPTQKPEKLLERIILASSNEGDVVFDPFVGGGTTVAVADKLGRKWIGIDQSVQAIKVSEYRLNKQQDLFSQPFTVQLHKYDYDTLRNKEAFHFEQWIVEQYGGKSNSKQRGDYGIDGLTRNGTPIQVKRSDNIGRNVIDNFKSALERYDKALYELNKKNDDPVGFIIAFSFGRGAVQEVARLKNEENIIIKLVTVEEIVPIAKKPKLTVTITDLGLPPLSPLLTKEGKDSEQSEESGVVEKSKKTQLREIHFTAVAESEAGIEMYAWDWDYEEDKPFKAEIILDKSGTQTMKFKPGNHTIAVKAVDNDGLEAIEVIKIKVNGVVERG